MTTRADMDAAFAALDALNDAIKPLNRGRNLIDWSDGLGWTLKSLRDMATTVWESADFKVGQAVQLAPAYVFDGVAAPGWRGWEDLLKPGSRARVESVRWSQNGHRIAYDVTFDKDPAKRHGPYTFGFFADSLVAA